MCFPPSPVAHHVVGRNDCRAGPCTQAVADMTAGLGLHDSPMELEATMEFLLQRKGPYPPPLDPKTMKNEGFTPQNMGYNP